MKKTSLARLIALVLIAIMAVTFFAACGKKPAQSSNGDAPVAGWTENSEKPDFDGKTYDFDGYEFNFICQPYLEDNAYSTNYMVAEGETGDVLLDAVYKRNSFLADKYNITFNQMKVDDLTTTVRTQVMGGACEFDVIVGSARRLASLAKEGRLLDLKTVEQFDMTKSYWDGNAARDLLIGECLYFTNCDFNVQELAFVVYFNKQLIIDKELDDPYQLMANNEWTIENWAKLVKAVADDVDGGGEWTETDRYGTLYEHHNGRMFLYGAGVRATTNNAKGEPEVTLMDSTNKAKTESVYATVKDVFSSSSSWSIDDMSSGDTHGYLDKFDYARSLFCQDLYLFHYEGTNIIHQFAEMESEFGILPFPKYNSAQESYYSMYPFNCAMVALPTTLTGEELERTAVIIEDLNYYSSLDVEPAWYEKLLKRRYANDADSEANLEIIKNGRVYDVGLYYNFGQICNELLDKDVRGSGSISTQYKRIEKSINSDIKITYRDIYEANKK